MKQIKFNAESKYASKNNSTHFDTITLNIVLTSVDEHLVKLDKKYNYKFTPEDYKTISDLDFSIKI